MTEFKGKIALVTGTSGIGLAAAIRLADLYREFIFDAEAVGVAEADLGLSLQDYLARGKA